MQLHFSKVSPMFMRAGWIQIILSGEFMFWRIKFTCAVETASEDSVIVTKNFTDIFGKKWSQEQFPGGACPQTPLAAVPLWPQDFGHITSK